MYVVELSQHAQGFLDNVDIKLKNRIEKTLKRLENNPFPKNAKFIGRYKSEKLFRYRIGDYRALYMVNTKDKVILVTKIDKRSRVYNQYKGLRLF